jgi:Autophagy protein Atg8 ubiquitin like
MMQFPRIWGSNEQKNKEAQTIPEDSQQQRFEEYRRVKQKYPDWLPVIIHSKDMTLTKQKYLTREEIPFKKFAEIVQDYCMVETPTGLQKIDRKVPLFFAVSGTLIPADENMGKVYKENKKADGFLHIDIRQEPDFNLGVKPGGVPPIAPPKDESKKDNIGENDNKVCVSTDNSNKEPKTS